MARNLPVLQKRLSEVMMSAAVIPVASDRSEWMALVAALLGWTFDGFEIGLFPLEGAAVA